MKKIHLLCTLYLLLTNVLFSQTITEKEIFTLNYKGPLEVYNFVSDKNTGTYCYLYTIEDENKIFIISNNSLSEKYDEASISNIHFDTKGNYYAVTGNYKPDYGIDNYFVVVNGKEVLNFNYIEGYSSFINKKGDFVFIFKEFDRYKLGFYNIETGLTKSEDFDHIKTIYSNDFSNLTEGESEAYTASNFYVDDNGERGYIANKDGKARMIFETYEIPTEYSDINETSLTKNKNNELSYIAKKGGKFYESAGNELVVSGGKEYDMFEIVSPSIIFNSENVPVYTAGDSLTEGQYDYYIVIGNDRQFVYLDKERSQKASRFGYGIKDLRINDDGTVSYMAMEEIIIPAEKKNPGEQTYDSYYSKSYFVKNGIAEELGYNLRTIKYDSNGVMLYAGIPDIKKKEPFLYQIEGNKKILLNKKSFDEIYEYGYSPAKDIFYVGQNYENPELNKKYESYLYLGDKLVGKYYAVTFQTVGDNGSILKFDSKNNYALVAEEVIDSANFSSYVISNKGKLPFPKTITKGTDKFNYITNLMYSKNDKLFYIGEMKIDTNYVKEVFVDNLSLGKTYNNIGEVTYDEIKNEVSFYAPRGKTMYYVTVQF